MADTGRGIPLHEQDRVFDEFYRIETTVRQRRGGMGLGLAIVRRQCELIGARIKLESAPGRGSRFIVTLNGVVLPPSIVNRDEGQGETRHPAVGDAHAVLTQPLPHGTVRTTTPSNGGLSRDAAVPMLDRSVEPATPPVPSLAMDDHKPASWGVGSQSTDPS